MLIFPSEQFYTNVIDHIAIHFTLGFLLLFVDGLIYHRRDWFRFKLHRQIWPDNLFNLLGVVILNQLIVTFPLFYFFDGFRPGSVWEWSNLFGLPVAILTEEVLFYHLHELLHQPWFYQHIHKIHHRWIYPIGLAATYAHPVEHALTNILPIILSAKMAGFTYDMVRVWHAFTLINAILIAHGGYKLPFLDHLHDIHHSNPNYNFGTLGLLDRLYGTYRSS